MFNGGTPLEPELFAYSMSSVFLFFPHIYTFLLNVPIVFIVVDF